MKSHAATVTYNVVLEGLPPNAGQVRAWIPLPPENEFQKIGNLTVEPQGEVHRDPTYGNSILYLEWNAPITTPLAATLTFDLMRSEETAHREDTPSALMDRYLQPDRMGVIDDNVRQMAADATSGRTGTIARARGIYDAVLAHMAYEKITPGWGLGDTARAYAVGCGNCSDYHALFVSMARAEGIPARFHYGMMLHADGRAGPHCWAEFYDSTQGWVPVDISEADKHPEMAEYYFGRLTEERVLFTTGRDIVLEPKQAAGPLNFLIKPYVEVDGEVFEDTKLVASHRASE